MSGNKVLYPLSFVAIMVCLVISRMLLPVADNILMLIDGGCRTLFIQCTGNDYDLALLITLLVVNAIVALVLVAGIKKLIHLYKK